ncbi:hypothetical protein Bpfe_014326 [Biomphalaria pfeifferi]|uniref:Uncharacterized protein n=1 Tax=Biomphalaria pfeifferi TaxID=112525 RepID=A0AAD8FAP6_BIOPF|nr:hypothetical protein Bpfe_014326 [Biomphalaria pfeifferi]
MLKPEVILQSLRLHSTFASLEALVQVPAKKVMLYQHVTDTILQVTPLFGLFLWEFPVHGQIEGKTCQ